MKTLLITALVLAFTWIGAVMVNANVSEASIQRSGEITFRELYAQCDRTIPNEVLQIENDIKQSFLDENPNNTQELFINGIVPMMAENIMTVYIIDTYGESCSDLEEFENNLDHLISLLQGE